MVAATSGGEEPDAATERHHVVATFVFGSAFASVSSAARRRPSTSRSATRSRRASSRTAAWIVPGIDPGAVAAIADVWSSFNDALEQTYAGLGVPVADMEGAFSADDFGTIVHVRHLGDVPLNVARVCQ
jgi:hypothetical protein